MRSEVQIFPDPPLFGAIAQLGERLPCTQEVGGSIPPGSTKFAKDAAASKDRDQNPFRVSVTALRIFENGL